VLLLCPIRHDWEIKGNQIIIQALPHILKKINKSITLIFCEWGQEVEKSKQLIKDLGIQEHIQWIRPLPKYRLGKYFKAVDVTLDQMILNCFGGIAPQSLAAGTPVIMSYKPECSAWMFPEPAPILQAFDAQEVCDRVLQALDPEWRKGFKKKAEEWIFKYHSPQVLLNEHLAVYKRVLSA
jgi:glycosyltransferase involved in cell wall biosynthesis